MLPAPIHPIKSVIEAKVRHSSFKQSCQLSSPGCFSFVVLNNTSYTAKVGCHKIMSYMMIIHSDVHASINTFWLKSENYLLEKLLGNCSNWSWRDKRTRLE